MKREIPWSSIIGFLLLLALGIGIPFWLEYKSLTNPAPPPIRAPKAEGRQAIDVRKGYYCANCGGNTSLPEWRDGPAQGDGLSSPLFLHTLESRAWERPSPSTRTPVEGTELRANP